MYVKIDGFAKGYTAIPNVNAPDITVRLQAVIDEYERDIYTAIFGCEIASKMFRTDAEDWAKELAMKFAHVAKYGLFVHWLREVSQQLTETGMVETDSNVAQNIPIRDRFVQACWRFVRNAEKALKEDDFKDLPTNLTVKPNFDNFKVNTFGL